MHNTKLTAYQCTVDHIYLLLCVKGLEIIFLKYSFQSFLYWLEANISFIYISK